MKIFHIHIQGIVQGVGFRPFVYKWAVQNNIQGWVMNAVDGVHIQFNASDKKSARQFLDQIIKNAPPQSLITHHSMEAVDQGTFHTFSIVESSEKGEANLLLTPDFATCSDCEKELFDLKNRRKAYPFISCTNCGPRYSIIKTLPYDRATTSMAAFLLCADCQQEYENPLDRRYFSQTNSCFNCKITLSLWENHQRTDNFENLDYIVEQWQKGKIIAIKGIAGYLLSCDATNKTAIKRLRALKNRPTKPFALMYHDIYELAEDVEMDIFDKMELESVAAPILLLKTQKEGMTALAMDEIAPNLKQIGVMMPATGLFKLLMAKFKRPIVATSGNRSNSTIIYKNQEAIEALSSIADIILLNNRDIIIPQDDSIVNYTTLKYQRTVLRRSRGLAPSYINPHLEIGNECLLAMGAMMKSSFSITHNNNIFVSQYLGNTLHYEAELNYKTVFKHFKKIVNPQFEAILVDKHPNYFATQYGKELAAQWNTPVIEIQHHKAHFLAVLAENNLLKTKEKVLGVIWDGIGLGDDGAIWGGEFFEYQNQSVSRIDHLDYFDFFLGDKMSKEPRISALSLAHDMEAAEELLKEKFSQQEWNIYKKLLAEGGHLKTSSVGRIFDALASIVLGINTQSYEGEAAILLENAAYQYFRANGVSLYYSYFKEEEISPLKELVHKVLQDIKKGFEPHFIAAKFHISMAHYIAIVAKKYHFTKVAFSGGVFQNAWLIDLVILFMDRDFDLYFHKDLPPNDENISFGQLMYHLYCK